MKKWKLLWRVFFSEAWLREEGGSGSGTLGAKRRFLWNGIDCMGQLENRNEEVKKGITNVTRSRGDP